MVRIVITALTAAVFFCTTAASAQPADLLRRAYELRLAGHDEAALPLLEQAYAASPTPGVAAQLGLCDEAVGRWEAAEQHLHEALAAPADPWVARHLQSLEGAYAVALAHFPRASSEMPREAAVTVVVPAVVPATVPAVSEHHDPVSTAIPRRAASAGAVRLGYVGVVAGSAFVVGGIVAWALRESIVDGFNGRGCRVGDPMPIVGCNDSAAISGRNTTTALAATGLVVGGVMGVAGAALLVMRGRGESFPQRGFALGAGPGDVGVSVVGRF